MINRITDFESALKTIIITTDYIAESVVDKRTIHYLYLLPYLIKL